MPDTLKFDTWLGSGDVQSPIFHLGRARDFGFWQDSGDVQTPVLEFGTLLLAFSQLIPYDSSVLLIQNRHIPLEWGGLFLLAKNENIPFAASGFLFLNADIPFESQQTLLEKVELPIEILQGLGRPGVLIPYEFAGEPIIKKLTVNVPHESGGRDPFSLLMVWNVLQLLDAPLMHNWLVISPLLVSALQHAWTVFESLAPLPHRWRDLPDIVTLFSADIQRPTASKEKT